MDRSPPLAGGAPPCPGRGWRAPLALFVAALLAVHGGGCLSHEHALSKDELRRLAQLPPEQRGSRVRVVQDLGVRRGEAIEGTGAWGQPVQGPAGPPPPPPGAQAYGPPGPPGYGPPGPPGPVVDAYADVAFNVNVNVAGGGGTGRPAGAPPATSFRGAPTPVGGGQRGGGPTGSPPGAAASGSFRGGGGAAPARGARAGGTARGGGGGSGLSLPSGGGGGDELVLVAIIVVAVAVFAATGLALTEGLRFDGHVDAHPGQLVYLTLPDGREEAVPLADLRPGHAEAATKAVLRDDEGWGFASRVRAPLDREGFAFKVDLGATSADAADSVRQYSLSGLASHIQLGYFPHHRVGLLAGLSLTGGADEDGGTFTRHMLAFEAQAFPLAWKRLHLGGFANVGSMVLRSARAAPDPALAIGGGALVELALTTRLALTARAAWSAARVENAWTTGRTFTAGIAIY